MTTERKTTAAPVIAVVVLFLVMLPVLHVASVGPAVWLEKHGRIPAAIDPAARAIYTPLRLARDRCPPFRVAIDFYVALWTG